MIIKIPSRLDLQLDLENKVIALENIVKAHGEGKHYVWMSANTVKELSQFEGFGHFARRTLDALMSQVSESAYLYREFAFYVLVNFSDGYALSYQDGVLDVGYLHFTDTAATQESTLLSENALDGDAYCWGAKTYLQIKRLNSLQVRLDIFPGGGNTTFDCFTRLDSSRRFFVSFIDSDKEHPKAGLGATAARFNRTSTGYARRRYLEILSCHEIENILPLQILKSVCTGKVVNSLVHAAEHIGFRCFADHKAGLLLSQAQAKDRLHNDDYWQAFDELDPETVLCSAFGENLLRDCVEYMSRLSPKQSKEHVDGELDAEWIRISRLIASWGVSSRGLVS
ncbi:hypothetical protein [Stutzerimonas balearica]|uniref:hypothetical protein n=1 Tax=Stutzerimonas balearica TaxID=74829 RepID=UPI0011AF0638|nr:hypothetical protein [Stutzerimonas balearica]